MRNLAALSIVSLLCSGITSANFPALRPRTIVTTDPLNQIVPIVELRDETIFDGIARLNQAFDISISIEGILPSSGTVPNPKFSASTKNRSIANVLTWLCNLDTRYTWTRDGNMVNIFPRASLDVKSYFFSRVLPEVRFNGTRESGVAAMEVVHQLGDPNEQLYFLGIGGTQGFAKPWTATFHDITVRQVLNRIAQQLGPTYGWQIGGTANQRIVMFHYKLGASATPPASPIPGGTAP